VFRSSKTGGTRKLDLTEIRLAVTFVATPHQAHSLGILRGEVSSEILIVACLGSGDVSLGVLNAHARNMHACWKLT
jgi:hypothetical protein